MGKKQIKKASNYAIESFTYWKVVWVGGGKKTPMAIVASEKEAKKALEEFEREERGE